MRLCFWCFAIFIHIGSYTIHLIAQVPKKGLDATKRLTQYVLDSWSIDDGLPQNSVSDLLQSTSGYIWFGTQEGLVRFDGVRFTVFDRSTTPEIGVHLITKIFEDGAGNLWIGKNGTLGVYKNGKFQEFTAKEGFEGDVNAFAQTASGLWIGTSLGLTNYTNGKFTTITQQQGLATNSVNDLKALPNGNILIATPAGFQIYHNGKFTTYTTQHGLKSNSVTRLLYGKNNTVWVGTSEGLQVFRDGVFTGTYTTQQGLAGNNITALYEDSQGVLFVGTDVGLCRFSGGKWEKMPAGATFGDENVSVLLEDREGSLWIGTSNGGLKRLRNSKFTGFGVPEGLPHNVVWTIYENSARHVWMSTDGGGVARIVNNQVTDVFNTKSGLPGNFIRPITEDTRGTMWFGFTQQGVGNFDGKKFRFFTRNDGLVDNAVTGLVADNAGNIWATTRTAGISVIQPAQNYAIRNITTANGLQNNGIWAVYKDKQGNLWFGSRGHALRHTPGTSTFTVIPTDSAADRSVLGFYQDAGGVMWFSTENGLKRYKNGKLTTYTVREGIANDMQFGITEDDNHNLWISCNKGVMRIPIHELNDVADGKQQKITHCTLFTKVDGLRNPEFNLGSPAVLKSNDGKIWFPSVGGATMIDPGHIPTNSIAPPVLIENVIVDKVHQNMDSVVRIEAGSENISIQFTALSFLVPSEVKFRYKLEGFDQDWVDAGTRREAFYTHLPHGEYTFRVLACNNDGVWNETGASLSLVLRPYFYRTTWFYALCMVFVVGAAAQSVRVRINHLRRKHDELELREKELNERIRGMVEEAVQRGEIEKHRIEEHALRTQEEKSYLAMSVEKILQEITKFAQGDLTVSLLHETEDEFHDEDIVRLYEGFTIAVENIRFMLQQVSEAVNITAEATLTITNRADDMAKQSREQSTKVTVISDNLSTLVQMVTDNFANVARVASTADKAEQSAQKGGQVMAEAIEGMNRINASVQRSADIVAELGKSSNQIGEIVEMINAIAGQTNLLALNAAIEAARAGAHGRGFAVVADEVRKLSERTTKATRQISDIIKYFQAEITDTIKTIEQGKTEVEYGKNLANNAAAALQEIIHEVQEVAGISTQLAHTSEQQTTASLEISKGVEIIRQTIDQATSDITEIAGSSVELSSLSSRLQKFVSRFKMIQ